MSLNKRLVLEYTKETKCLENITKMAKEDKGKGFFLFIFLFWTKYMKEVYKKGLGGWGI